MVKIKPVIMAGGIGTRLWPISKEIYPKQFARLFNNYSLLQNTLLRNKSFGKPIVIINEQHRFLAIEQIKEIGIEATLVIEPCGKNTGSCAVIGALMAKEEGADRVILLPADHNIADQTEYLSSIHKALPYSDSAIVSIGITPNHPHTGYGYMKIEEQLGVDVYSMKEFKEKPKLSDAEDYLRQGGYYWNSGIFIYGSGHLLKQAKALQPKMLSLVQESFNNSLTGDGQVELEPISFNKLENLSFDKCIMELTCDRVVVRGNFTWQDLGSWDSLWRMSKKDKAHNYLGDNVVVDSVSNSYVKSNNKAITVIGLDNVVIINTDEGLLVANRLMLDKLHGLSNNSLETSREHHSYATEEALNFDLEEI
jgi:mannose-1-phosphate guanylyltransferase